MIIVAPSVKSVEMATEISRRMLSHVRLLRELFEAIPTQEGKLEAERGWDAEEIKKPILFDLFSSVYMKSELFLIFSFKSDGTIGSIQFIPREILFRGL